MEWKVLLSLLLYWRDGWYFFSIFYGIFLDLDMISCSGWRCNRWESGAVGYYVSHPYKWNEFLYIINKCKLRVEIIVERGKRADLNWVR